MSLRRCPFADHAAPGVPHRHCPLERCRQRFDELAADFSLDEGLLAFEEPMVVEGTGIP